MRLEAYLNNMEGRVLLFLVQDAKDKREGSGLGARINVILHDRAEHCLQELTQQYQQNKWEDQVDSDFYVLIFIVFEFKIILSLFLLK
jgi:hypothetical protein